MAEFVERPWHAVDAAQLSRRDRAPGRYRAYVPVELGEALPELGPEARQAAEDALAVLARADERIGTRGQYLHYLLIRSESISSSWIEGNRVTPKRLAIAEVLQQGSRVALDVVANVRATEEAIADLADPARPIAATDLIELQHLIEPSLAPGLRTEQNWVVRVGVRCAPTSSRLRRPRWHGSSPTSPGSSRQPKGTRWCARRSRTRSSRRSTRLSTGTVAPDVH